VIYGAPKLWKGEGEGAGDAWARAVVVGRGYIGKGGRARVEKRCRGHEGSSSWEVTNIVEGRESRCSGRDIHSKRLKRGPANYRNLLLKN